jgi:hypothetical protein
MLGVSSEYKMRRMVVMTLCLLFSAMAYCVDAADQLTSSAKMIAVIQI